jgi:hypothetical protein
MTTGFEHGFRPCRTAVIEGMTGPVVGTPISFGFDNDSRGADAFRFSDQNFSDQFSGQRNHIGMVEKGGWKHHRNRFFVKLRIELFGAKKKFGDLNQTF